MSRLELMLRILTNTGIGPMGAVRLIFVSVDASCNGTP